MWEREEGGVALPSVGGEHKDKIKAYLRPLPTAKQLEVSSHEKQVAPLVRSARPFMSNWGNEKRPTPSSVRASKRLRAGETSSCTTCCPNRLTTCGFQMDDPDGFPASGEDLSTVRDPSERPGGWGDDQMWSTSIGHKTKIWTWVESTSYHPFTLHCIALFNQPKSKKSFQDRMQITPGTSAIARGWAMNGLNSSPILVCVLEPMQLRSSTPGVVQEQWTKTMAAIFQRHIKLIVVFFVPECNRHAGPFICQAATGCASHDDKKECWQKCHGRCSSEKVRSSRAFVHAMCIDILWKTVNGDILPTDTDLFFYFLRRRNSNRPHPRQPPPLLQKPQRADGVCGGR